MKLLIPHLKGLELRDTTTGRYVAIYWPKRPIKTLKRMYEALNDLGLKE